MRCIAVRSSAPRLCALCPRHCPAPPAPPPRRRSALPPSAARLRPCFAADAYACATEKRVSACSTTPRATRSARCRNAAPTGARRARAAGARARSGEQRQRQARKTHSRTHQLSELQRTALAARSCTGACAAARQRSRTRQRAANALGGRGRRVANRRSASFAAAPWQPNAPPRRPGPPARRSDSRPSRACGDEPLGACARGAQRCSVAARVCHAACAQSALDQPPQSCCLPAQHAGCDKPHAAHAASQRRRRARQGRRRANPVSRKQARCVCARAVTHRSACRQATACAPC